MKVSLDEVRKMFEVIILKKMEREDVSNWATLRMLANDDVQLEYEPKSEEEKIWNGLCYLSGIDLIRDVEGTFLYSLDDVVAYRNEQKI